MRRSGRPSGRWLADGEGRGEGKCKCKQVCVSEERYRKRVSYEIKTIKETERVKYCYRMKGKEAYKR